MKVKRFYKFKYFTPWKMELYYFLKSIFFFPKSTISKQISPKKILLCNLGALGDVFLTTCMIPSLKEAFPTCLIGMLIKPSSRPAIEGCPGVDEIHEMEPWFRPADSKRKKLQRRMQYKKKAYAYDWVICTFPFYCGIGSSFQHIPTRICFETLGDHMYFNQIIPWENGYIGKQYVRLLAKIGVKNPKLVCPWELQPRKLQVGTKDFVIFHMGSRDSTKEYPLSFWQDLYAVYQSEGRKVLFTGNGKKQHLMIQRIAKSEENICDRLTFLQFLQLIANADHIVSVDTVTIHIAAMLGKPYFVLFNKASDITCWFPDTEEGACLA